MLDSVILICAFLRLDERVQPIKARRPHLFPLPQPAIRFGERFGVQAAQLHPPDLAARDQTGAFQHLHMLGGTGEAHRERLRQFADRLFAEREIGEHAPPSRVGEGVECGIESFNHVV